VLCNGKEKEEKKGPYQNVPHVSRIGFIKEISSKRNMELRLWWKKEGLLLLVVLRLVPRRQRPAVQEKGKEGIAHG